MFYPPVILHLATFTLRVYPGCLSCRETRDLIGNTNLRVAKLRLKSGDCNASGNAGHAENTRLTFSAPLLSSLFLYFEREDSLRLAVRKSITFDITRWLFYVLLFCKRTSDYLILPSLVLFLILDHVWSFGLVAWSMKLHRSSSAEPAPSRWVLWSQFQFNHEAKMPDKLVLQSCMGDVFGCHVSNHDFSVIGRKATCMLKGWTHISCIWSNWNAGGGQHLHLICTCRQETI